MDHSDELRIRVHDRVTVIRLLLFVLAWVLPALLLLLVCGLPRAEAAGVRVQPYTEVTYTPGEVHFSGIAGPGYYDASMSMTVKVDTNCNIGGLTLDATVLTLVQPALGPPQGAPTSNDPPATIPTSRLYVKATGMNDYAALTEPVIVMTPMGPGHHEITLWFRVKVELTDPAGRYNGKYHLNCLPAP